MASQWVGQSPIKQLLVAPKIKEPLLHYWGYLSRPALVLGRTIDCFSPLVSCIAPPDHITASPQVFFKVSSSSVSPTPVSKICGVFSNRAFTIFLIKKCIYLLCILTAVLPPPLLPVPLPPTLPLPLPSLFSSISTWKRAGLTGIHKTWHIKLAIESYVQVLGGN